MLFYVEVKVYKNIRKQLPIKWLRFQNDVSSVIEPNTLVLFKMIKQSIHKIYLPFLEKLILCYLIEKYLTI